MNDLIKLKMTATSHERKKLMKTIKTIALTGLAFAAFTAPVLAQSRTPMPEKPRTAATAKHSGTVQTIGNKMPAAYAGISRRG